MSDTVVSIVLPTFNRANLLKLSIESVLCQSFQRWELLVLDNGSTDGTSNLLKELVEKDSRIRYFQIPRSNLPGISYYLNFGIKSSRGKYIARLDDDDTWCFEDKLKQQVEFLDSNPDYVLVGGGVIMVDSNNKEFHRYIKKEKDEEIRKYALLSCPFDHPTIMFRKDISESIRNYKNLKVAEDWDFFLRLGKAGKFYNFQEYYTNYLQAGQNISLKDDREIAKTELCIIKTYRCDYPNYYLGVLLHCAQYLYSFLPNFVKVRFQYLVRYLKRKLF
jgi:glycosyltransferase involved in cell wall biosynthesis